MWTCRKDRSTEGTLWSISVRQIMGDEGQWGFPRGRPHDVLKADVIGPCFGGSVSSEIMGVEGFPLKYMGLDKVQDPP